MAIGAYERAAIEKRMELIKDRLANPHVQPAQVRALELERARLIHELELRTSGVAATGSDS